MARKPFVGAPSSTQFYIPPHIQSDFENYLESDIPNVNFTFELLEECDRDKLPERERYYIATFSTKTNGYNKTDGG